jgi:hypothetical protein
MTLYKTSFLPLLPRESGANDELPGWSERDSRATGGSSDDAFLLANARPRLSSFILQVWSRGWAWRGVLKWSVSDPF